MIYQIGMTRVMVNNFQEVSETSHLSSGLSRNRISMLALMTSLCMLPPKYECPKPQSYNDEVPIAGRSEVCWGLWLFCCFQLLRKIKTDKIHDSPERRNEGLRQREPKAISKPESLTLPEDPYRICRDNLKSIPKTRKPT